MNFSLSAFSAHRNFTPLIFLLLLTFAMGRAEAITIDFDDLNPEDFINTEDPDRGLIPLTDEYEALGVIFVDGAYLGGGSPKSSPNFVNGPGFSFYFLGRLPTYVSMYAGSLTEYKVGISAYGANGPLGYFLTDGLVTGMGSDESTPYRDNQLVSFFEPEGIFSIHLSGQADTYIDDLSFVFDVSEPGTYLLFIVGMLSICLRRKHFLDTGH